MAAINKHGERYQRPDNPRIGTDAFWIFGRHSSLAAAANPHRHVRQLLALSNHAHALADAAERAGRARPDVEVVSRHDFSQVLPPGTTHQGLAVLASPLRPDALEDILDRHTTQSEQLLIVLDQVSDPRNVGAVLRSAAAFGVAAVVLQDRHAPHESGVLAKAASGALETVPLVRVTNIARALRLMREHAFTCVGLDHAARQSVNDAQLPDRMSFVIGAEGTGLRRLVRDTCDMLACIPIAPEVDSLNLSVAASLAMFIYRQGRG